MRLNNVTPPLITTQIGGRSCVCWEEKGARGYKPQDERNKQAGSLLSSRLLMYRVHLGIFLI